MNTDNSDAADFSAQLHQRFQTFLDVWSRKKSGLSFSRQKQT
jgi:hypothetical protein